MKLQDIIAYPLSIVFLYGISRLLSRKKRYFFKQGIRSTAEVVKVIETGITYGSGSARAPVVDLVLQVRQSDHSIKKVFIKQSYSGNIPKVGDQVNVLIDPKDTSQVMVISNLNGDIYRTR